MTVFAHPLEGGPEIFAPTETNGIVWVSPGLCKATMGAAATCSKCGAEHQLRMLIVEELKLPMGFFPVEEDNG
jgi:hypothetical protein